MKKYFFLFINLLCGFLIFAQSDYNQEIFSVVGPQAFEMTKYGDVPVSSYTGLTTNQIPIYKIKTEGLDFPISLSYHAGGIRVSEESGWVGLGWSLNAVGEIVQVVNQYDDYGGYSGSYDLDYDDLEVESGVPDNFFYSGDYGSGISDYELNGLFDTQRDFFKFNFLQYSGEFVFDFEEQEFVCLNDPQIKIEFTSGLGVGSEGPFIFKITVAEGHVFFFSFKNATTIRNDFSQTYKSSGASSSGSSVDLIGQVQSRYYALDKILTNRGEWIEFSYENTSSLVNIPSYSFSRTSHDYEALGITLDIGAIKDVYPEWQETYSYLQTEQEFTYLTSIKTDRIIVEFVSDDEREDFVGTNRLEEINVYNLLYSGGANAKNELLHSYKFTYDYFNGHTDGNSFEEEIVGNVDIGKGTDELVKRLKLIEFQEEGSEPFSFEYNSEQLPKKTSWAYDHWGFYNGRLNGTKEADYESRSPSEKYAQSAILERISYPTGGYTTFNYELNQFVNYSVPNYQDEDLDAETYEMFILDDNTGYSSYTPNVDDRVYSASDNNFFFKNDQDGIEKQFYGSLSVVGPCAEIDLEEDYNYYYDTYIKLNVYNEDALALVEQYGWTAITSFINNDEYIIETVEYQLPRGTTFEEWPLSTVDYGKGIYHYIVNLNGDCGPQDSSGEGGFAFVNFKYKDTGIREITGSGSSEGAGLRVKDVGSYSEDGSPVTSKSYDYEDGQLMTPIFYESSYTFYYKMYNPDAISDCIHYEANITRTNKSAQPVISASTSASGKYVGYSAVKETVIDTETNNRLGYTVSKYRNFDDFVGSGVFSFLPSIKSLGVNGSLLQETIYDADENRMSATDYGYSYSLEKEFSDCKLQYLYSSPYVAILCTQYYESIYAGGFFPIRQVLKTLVAKTETLYDGDGSPFSKNSTYDYTSNGLLRDEIIVKSRGLNGEEEVVETEYYYPQDYDSDVALALTDNNYLNTVLNIKKWNSGELIYEENRDFISTSSGNYNGYDYESFDIETLSNRFNEADDFVAELEVEKYYDGKPVQVIGKDGVRKTLLWGYNSEYIVAEILDITYNEVMSNVDQSVLDFPLSDTEFLEELTGLRSAFPDYMITTYQYKPGYGVIRQTDPSGLVTKFTYDYLGRLSQIKDEDGNILEQYTYHFKE